MRVLFLVREDAAGRQDGPSEQVRQYASAVVRHGGSAEISTGRTVPRGRFDVAHVLNLDWPVETARQMAIARAAADRVLLSPIHHHRPWELEYHAHGRAGGARRLARLVDLERFMRLRGCAQAVRQPWLAREGVRQLVWGATRRQRELLREADAWVLLSERERASIAATFGVAPAHAEVVRNGADWVDDDVALAPLPDEFVLCVARIEARKNQLGLARALVELGVPGVFVGARNARHRSYVRRFARFVEAHPSLTWLSSLGRAETLALFRRARLHVLPSWYEVSALVDLEAAVAGCPLVTTAHGYSSEALGDAALYWDPVTGPAGLRETIREALERAQRPDAPTVTQRREALAWSAVTEPLLRLYAS